MQLLGIAFILYLLKLSSGNGLLLAVSCVSVVPVVSFRFFGGFGGFHSFDPVVSLRCFGF